MLDTAGVDEAKVDALVEKEKPVAELVPPEGAVLLLTLKPGKDPPLPEEGAEAAAIAAEAVLAEEAKPNAGAEVDCAVLLDAGVDVSEGAAEVTIVGVDGLANAEALEKEKPEEAENGVAGLELEVEPAVKGLESEGVGVPAKDEVDEPNKFEAGNAEETVVDEEETEEATNREDPEAATDADDPALADVADAPNSDAPEVITPNKGVLELAAEEDAPSSEEPELAPANEDEENKDEPALAEEADDPNKDGADEPKIDDPEAAADGDDPKIDDPEPAPNGEGAEDDPNSDELELDELDVAELKPNEKEGAEEAEDEVVDPNPSDEAEVEAVVEAENKDEDEEAEDEAELNGKENEGAEEAELGFEEEEERKGEGDDANENPVEGVDDPRVDGEDANEKGEAEDDVLANENVEDWEEEDDEDDPNDKPDIAARSLSTGAGNSETRNSVASKFQGLKALSIKPVHFIGSDFQ